MLQSRSAVRALAKNRTNSPSPSSRQGRLFPPFSRISVVSLLGSNLLLRPVVDEAFAEDDGELSFCHGPLTRRHPPLFFRAVQDQIQQLGGGIVAGEVAPGPDGAPEL